MEHFRSVFGDALLAVVFYGSCLTSSTRSATSFLDFYLIADTYADFHKKRIHASINRLMPPAVFYLELTGPDGQKATCKYCVISLDDLEKATGKHARDLYHLGRFSKRIAVLYAQGESVVQRLVDVAFSAWDVLTPHALAATSSSFTLEDFAKSLLSLSYRGEVRLEQTDQKVAALYEAQKPFYDEVFRVVLDRYAAQHRDRFKVDDAVPQGTYLLRRTTAYRAAGLKKLNAFLAKSRRRGKLRWPLMMFTVDNWVDILLAKLERTYGTRLELTPLERRFIIIFGWRHYFRLRREGKVK